MWPADHKLPGRVYMVRDIVAKQGFHTIRQLRDYPWHEDVNDIFLNFCQHRLVGIKLIVLGRHHNRIHPFRRIVVVVFNGHLRFRIRPQISHFLSLATNSSQLNQDQMRQFERQWHVVVSFLAGITKHHSLVSGTLIHSIRLVNPAVNIGTLLMNSGQHPARIPIKTVLGFGITNFVNHFTGSFQHIHIGLRFHFASQHHLPGCNQGFNRYFRIGVKG